MEGLSKKRVYLGCNCRTQTSAAAYSLFTSGFTLVHTCTGCTFQNGSTRYCSLVTATNWITPCYAIFLLNQILLVILFLNLYSFVTIVIFLEHPFQFCFTCLYDGCDRFIQSYQSIIFGFYYATAQDYRKTCTKIHFSFCKLWLYHFAVDIPCVPSSNIPACCVKNENVTFLLKAADKTIIFFIFFTKFYPY